MSTRILKVLLLVALLAAFVASSKTAFAGASTCRCHAADFRQLVPPGGCHFDQSTSQCVSVSCRGVCY
jgi:hypothetical protein